MVLKLIYTYKVKFQCSLVHNGDYLLGVMTPGWMASGFKGPVCRGVFTPGGLGPDLSTVNPKIPFI